VSAIRTLYRSKSPMRRFTVGVHLPAHYMLRQLSARGVHGDGEGGNPAESAGFPRVWV